ncbi:MAG: FKBP-type peptidyl-prolyl cis-trans isomerase [Nevskia sp.]
MFKPSRALLLLASAALVVACSKPAAENKDAAAAAPGAAASTPSDLTTDAQKFGYSIGVDLGRSLAQVKDDVDVKSLEKGLEEVAGGKEPRLDDKTREEIKNSVAKKIQEKQVAERTQKAEKAKTDGAAFLAENGKKDGVKTTASGLQYTVEKDGDGAAPTAADKVTVNYKGTLLNGETFDSSYDRGQPVTFPLANVIPGWTEGLQLMKAGGKAKFWIPSALAYGDRGAGGKIGPNETLAFEVELISVEKGEAPKADAPKLEEPKAAKKK